MGRTPNRGKSIQNRHANRPINVRVARLQKEVGAKDLIRGTNFLKKNAPKFSPKFLSLCSVGPKKARKIPAKFPSQN